jgi:hypothetical protein
LKTSLFDRKCGWNNKVKVVLLTAIFHEASLILALSAPNRMPKICLNCEKNTFVFNDKFLLYAQSSRFAFGKAILRQLQHILLL